MITSSNFVQRSLREISAELAARGFVAERSGQPYQAAQVSRTLAEEKKDDNKHRR